MSIYTNVISSTKTINRMRTFINGAAKDIKSVWTFVNGKRQILYPNGGVIVNLSGASSYEEDIIYAPGKYRIEVAPGLGSDVLLSTFADVTNPKIVHMDYVENITAPFFVRAYCGSNAVDELTPGVNPYSGSFKVNAVDARTIDSSMVGIDVNHIFGAGGGNSLYSGGGLLPQTAHYGGGANCLGDGNIVVSNRSLEIPAKTTASGAGSCLHLLPVGGVFGTNYIRAYHAAPTDGRGSAYGGGGTPPRGSGSAGWFTRGGNSPYGDGAITDYSAGLGIGAGGIFEDGYILCGAGAYFNGSEWVDAHGQTPVKQNGMITNSSYIRITYLGPLD